MFIIFNIELLSSIEKKIEIVFDFLLHENLSYFISDINNQFIVLT